ncbi:MAG TPA: hypothetical protein VIC54_02755 [Terriglobales bacterium]
MVSKKCAGCGQYFSGDLNGDYLCPACAHLEAMPQRPLSSLSGFDMGDAPLNASPDVALDASFEAGAPADGARRPADQAHPRNVKGQAA